MRDVRTVGRIISGSPGARFREEQVARAKNKLAKGEGTREELKVAESGLERQRALRKPKKRSSE
jgi:hypothetical protein